MINIINTIKLYRGVFSVSLRAASFPAFASV